MQTVSKRPEKRPVRTSANPCETGNCSGFAYGVLERPRYYPRQLMTPNELQLEADYFRDRLRRHNLYLHGWGVVCGALVCVVPAERQTGTRSDYQRVPASETATTNGNGTGKQNGATWAAWLVQVKEGYVLGPYGDEIIIDHPVQVDLRGTGVSGCGSESSDDLADPWCSEVFVDRPQGTVYVAVRYKECQVRPVRAQPAGCGCDDVSCEYSRFRDGFEIGLLDCCPASHHPDDVSTWERRDLGNPACPECPDSPWVVLAEITIDADGTITAIDNCSCRRIVPSTRDRWMQCSGTDCDQPQRATDVNEGDEATPAPAGGVGDQPPGSVETAPPKRQRSRGRG